MAPFNRGGSRGGGKSFGGGGGRGGGRGGFRAGRGSSRGGRGGFNNSRSGSAGNGHDSSYSNNDYQQNGYYDQQQPQQGYDQSQYAAQDPNGAPPAAQDYNYDQYQQQAPPGSAGGEYQYDANAYPQQQYYDYSQQPPADGQYADPNGQFPAQGAQPGAEYGEYHPQDPNAAVAAGAYATAPPDATTAPPGAYPPAQEDPNANVSPGSAAVNGAAPPATGAEAVQTTEAQFAAQGAEHDQLNKQAAATGTSLSGEAVPTAGSAEVLPANVLDQTGCWVDRRYYDEMAKKLEVLRQNYASVTKKYQDLKEKYKQSVENAEKKHKYLNEKLKKSQAQLAQKTERTSISIPGPEGDGEVQVDAENVQYKNKDDVKQNTVMSALKAEREFYKGKSEKLHTENKKVIDEKTDILKKNQTLEEEIADFKKKYMALETEKESLEAKLASINNNEVPKSPVYDKDCDKDVDGVTSAGDKSLAERKEYYKNKYLKLLEEKNEEQQNFLQINKRLLEKFLFKEEDVAAK